MGPISLRAFEGRIDLPSPVPVRPWIAAFAHAPDAAASPAVLVIDSDAGVRALCRTTLEQAGFGVTAVADGKSALAAMQRGAFFAVVVEMLMPGMDGIEILRHIRRHFPQMVVIAMNSLAEKFDYLHVAVKLGADDILPKPIDPAALIRVVRRQENADASGEQRQYERQGMALAGQLFMTACNAVMPCEVINLSAGGAMVTCHDRLDETRPLILYVDHFGRLECRIAHVTGEYVGLEFTLGPAKRAQLRNLLAAYNRDGVTALSPSRHRQRTQNRIALVRTTASAAS